MEACGIGILKLKHLVNLFAHETLESKVYGHIRSPIFGMTILPICITRPVTSLKRKGGCVRLLMTSIKLC